MNRTLLLSILAVVIMHTSFAMQEDKRPPLFGPVSKDIVPITVAILTVVSKDTASVLPLAPLSSARPLASVLNDRASTEANDYRLLPSSDSDDNDVCCFFTTRKSEQLNLKSPKK